MAELLIPLSSLEMIKAAAENGADALLYDGTEIFGENDLLLKEALSYAVRKGVRSYFELDPPKGDKDVLRFARETERLARAGADALVLSSAASAAIARKISPDIRLFAGPEMPVTSLDGMEEMKKLGFERVTAAKELNKYQIDYLKEYGSLPLAVVVQDEMCMSYGGQCHADLKHGGYCEEFCRGVFAFSGTGRRRQEFPLSLKDVCLAAHVRELLLSGVNSLMVGRSLLRTVEDVTAVTSAYARIVAEERYPSSGEMRILTRAARHGGFSDGFFEGRPGPDMQGRPENAGYTLPVFDTASTLDELPVTAGRKTKVTFLFVAKAGEAAFLGAVDSLGNRAMVRGAVPETVSGETRVKDAVRLRLSGGRSGEDWRVDRAMVRMDDGVTVDPGEVERMRLAVLQALRKKRFAPSVNRVFPYKAPAEAEITYRRPRLILSYRRFEQIDRTALTAAPQFIYLPLDEILAGGELTEKLLGCGVKLAAVLPPTVTDNETEKLLESLVRAKNLGVDHAVAGTLAVLETARRAGMILRGDFGLNARTSEDIAALTGLGFSSVSISFDLTFREIRALRKPAATEIFAYGRLPLMLTENCISRNHYGVCDKCETQRMITGRDGETYPILGEPGCRNLLLDSRKIYLADRADDLEKLGVESIRLSFTTENRSECAEIVRQYYERNARRSLQKPWRGVYYES
ncbi:MAG: U32 family peptidase [Clostridia bacterium]|nr:U32 family peptidase [Clostridia bacterium]